MRLNNFLGEVYALQKSNEDPEVVVNVGLKVVNVYYVPMANAVVIETEEFVPEVSQEPEEIVIPTVKLKLSE